MNKQDKKMWEVPELVTYGDVETLTQQVVKPKQPGSRDDFGVSGVSSP